MLDGKRPQRWASGKTLAAGSIFSIFLLGVCVHAYALGSQSAASEGLATVHEHTAATSLHTVVRQAPRRTLLAAKGSDDAALEQESTEEKTDKPKSLFDFASVLRSGKEAKPVDEDTKPATTLQALFNKKKASSPAQKKKKANKGIWYVPRVTANKASDPSTASQKQQAKVEEAISHEEEVEAVKEQYDPNSYYYKFAILPMLQQKKKEQDAALLEATGDSAGSGKKFVSAGSAPVANKVPEADLDVIYDAMLPDLFTVAEYVSYNPDLTKAGITGDHQLKKHYILFGKDEGRRYTKNMPAAPAPPSNADIKVQQSVKTLTQEQQELLKQLPEDFTVKGYLEQNPDLVKSGLVSDVEAKLHYLTFGKQEKRRFKPLDVDPKAKKPKDFSKLPVGFDWKEYLNLNGDLMKKGIFTELDAKAHYVDHGMKERRRWNEEQTPEELEAAAEASQPMVAQVVEYSDDLQVDDRGLPTDFSWETYLALNPTLGSEHGISTQKLAEAHYVISGRLEQLPYKVDQLGLPADFNWEHYVAMNPLLVQLGITSELAADAHYFWKGQKAGWRY